MKRRPPPHQAVAADATQTLTASPGAGSTPPADRPMFERGACLGRYVILQAIGSGGIGNVFSAYDPELDRKVALKVLRADHLHSEAREEAQLRLRREAQAVAKLAHPHVVSVFDVGTVGERLFVTMELIEGETLAEWLAAEKRTRREILRMFDQAGRGLAAAHRAGLVHRDFKPSNVMVTREGKAQVVDFGLARAVDGGQAPSGSCQDLSGARLAAPLTLTGKTLGTPAYMAPEQHAGTVTDTRADQFSFCLTLYEALYDELAFGGGTVAEFRRNVERGDIREAPPGSPVPNWLRRVLLRGLSRDPAARFPDMEALLAALTTDPAARRRRWLAAMVAILVSAAGLNTLRTSQTQQDLLCKGAERKLQGIWDVERQGMTHQAFLTTDLPYAEDAWQRAKSALDSYTTAWVDLHTKACEATRQRGEQSEELLDLQMTCLDNRLLEVGAVTGQLLHADAQAVQNATRVTDSLSSLLGCADRRTLSAVLLPPEDPGTVIRVAEIRKRLAEAKALEAIGRYPEGLELATAAAEAAGELAYRPLTAEALFQLAEIQGRLNIRPDMKNNLLEAAAIAQATGHDVVLARAQTFLIVSAARRGQSEEGYLWERLATAAIERLGGRPDLEADLLFFKGLIAGQRNQPEEAVQYYRASLAVDPEVGPARLGAAQSNIAAKYASLGRFDQARELSLQALATLEQAYGPEHPELSFPLMSLGRQAALKDDYPSALPLVERSVAILEAAVGPDEPATAHGLLALGEILIELDRAEESVPHLERAVATLEARVADPVFLAESRFFLARALWITGRERRRARELAHLAEDSFAQQGDRSRDQLHEVRTWLAERGWLP